MYSAPSTSRGPAPSTALRSIGDLAATCYTPQHTSTPYDDLVTQGNHHQPRGYTDPSNMYGSYPPVAHQPIEDNYSDDATRRKRVRTDMKRIGVRG